MLDMACNSANICSYGIKQHKPKQSKYHTSLPNFNEIWLQQNQTLQQNSLGCEQSFLNHSQLTSPPTSTLRYLLQQGKKRAEDRSVLNASQTNPYNSTYNNQYNSQYDNSIAPYMSNQATSAAAMQPHYQPTPITLPLAEQHLRYQQQDVYYENGQSYLPRNAYSSNYNSLSITATTITQNLSSPIVRPLPEVPQQDNIYVAPQYVTQQSYAGNNSEQQNQTAANNRESTVVRPPQEVLQQDNLYAAQQYVAQQNYTGDNGEQQSHIATDTPKSKQQQIQHYAWMKSKHDPGNENKRARKRQTYTQHQTFRLEEVFYGSRYLSKAERGKLSKQLNLSEQQIKIWFQNRRMKAKKEQQSQLPVNQPRLNFNETTMQEQSISQQESVIHQQQSPVQQQWPTTQHSQLQSHQNYQNCPQQQYVYPCVP